jgi:hypothetical protein
MDIAQSTELTKSRIRAAAALIRSARYLTAFTGAGISVESGIPPFRGPGGLWGEYDPRTLELDFFLAHPADASPVIREIFYDNFGKAKPNAAHLALAHLEAKAPAADGRGKLKVLITQNIDSVQWNYRGTLPSSLHDETSFFGSTEQRAKNSISQNALCDRSDTNPAPSHIPVEKPNGWVVLGLAGSGRARSSHGVHLPIVPPSRDRQPSRDRSR